ncbi:MAG: hypothetical protein ACEY3F_03195 [Wolbachia sp.]
MSKNNFDKNYDGYTATDTSGKYSGTPRQTISFQKLSYDGQYGALYSVLDVNGEVIGTTGQHCIPKFFNKIYKPSESKIFDKALETIEEVLPKVFSFQDEGIKYNIKYDDMSSQEKFQIQKDIHAAYENFKKLFDVNKPETTLNLEVNVFNNKNDYQKYNELAGIDADNAYGATDGKAIVVYKFAGMDFVLGHELGHVFQNELLTSMKNSLDPELVGNLIGNQVEEENKKDIDSGQTKEYQTEEYENPAHNKALELRESDEDDKREVQKETAKLDDNTEESQSTQTSEPGTFSSIASIFRSFISWIWGTEEESESIELSQSSLYSDPLSDESHYSQSDTNDIL